MSFSKSKQEQLTRNFDEVETYFECITTCSINDGDCLTRCVEELKETEL